MAMNDRDAQKLYGGTNTPGYSAFRAAYDRLKSESQAQRQAIGQDYAGIYQQLRGQQYGQGLGAAAQRGLSGGQAAGMQNRVSAAQMGQLGNVLQQQQRAIGEQTMGEASIYSNALLEGQQAQEYAQREQQTRFQRQVTANQILNKKGDYAGYSTEQQRAALITLGYTPRQVDGFLGKQETTQAQYNEAFGNLNPTV
jgi:hypothetical protein